MTPYTTVYVMPVFEEHRILGWTWELVSGGRLVAHGDTPRESIDLARAEGMSRTRTRTYPGSLVEWDRFWNESEEEKSDGRS
jgi:hypothetical protein